MIKLKDKKTSIILAIILIFGYVSLYNFLEGKKYHPLPESWYYGNIHTYGCVKFDDVYMEIDTERGATETSIGFSHNCSTDFSFTIHHQNITRASVNNGSYVGFSNISNKDTVYLEINSTIVKPLQHYKINFLQKMTLDFMPITLSEHLMEILKELISYMTTINITVETVLT